MAKSFSSIKKHLGLLDFITVGKYKNCRVDSIIEQDPDYLIYMDKEKILKFAPEVLERLMKKFSTDSIEVDDATDTRYDPTRPFDDYWDDDIPF